VLVQQDGVSGTSTIASVADEHANVTLARAFADRHNLSYISFWKQPSSKSISSALRTSHAYLVV
jgi:hypothetical protein